MIFQDIFIDEYYRIVHAYDNDGFDAYVAIHNVNLGVAVGGCRALEYDSPGEALKDALRLAKGMTYKNAMAGLPYGGGKAVINGKPTPTNMKKFAEVMNYVNRDDVVYITAGDMNTGPAELDVLSDHTEFVNHTKGPQADSGMATAFGVYQAMLGACDALERSIRNQEVSISGYGKVGSRLSDFLLKDKIPHSVSDINPISHEKYVPSLLGAGSVGRAHTYGTIWAPCAGGGAVNERNITDIPQGHIICGGANNQLDQEGSEIYDLGVMLLIRNITYIPDYVANAGGVIIIMSRGKQLVDLEYDSPEVMPRLLKIRETARRIALESRETGIPSQIIADAMAERIIYG